MSIGKRIRELRDSMSQAEFAKVVGIPKNTLGRYERGEIIPGGEALALLCTKLSVNPNWLLLGRGVRDAITNQQDNDESFFHGTQVLCSRCKELEGDLKEERTLVKELVTENRQLLKENGDLRVELERAKARAAPDADTVPEGTRRSA